MQFGALTFLKMMMSLLVVTECRIAALAWGQQETRVLGRPLPSIDFSPFIHRGRTGHVGGQGTPEASEGQAQTDGFL